MNPDRAILSSSIGIHQTAPPVRRDGLSDHVGIVERVENGIVYTVEGNSGDSCRSNSYSVGYYEILGYGTPAY